MSNLARLRSFIQDMTRAVERHGANEPRMLDEGEKLLRGLIASDDWLPEAFAAPSPEGYRQYLLHCDPLERFSVVSFVWMPGQRTPIHDHTVWGLVGVMRGAERCEECRLVDGWPALSGAAHVMQPGDVEAVSPTVSISSHRPNLTRVFPMSTTSSRITASPRRRCGSPSPSETRPAATAPSPPALPA